METISNGVLSPRGELGWRPYLMVYFHHEGVGKETIFDGVLSPRRGWERDHI